MPFCSAIATNGALGFVAQTDLILALGLHLCRDNLFNMPYSISATLPEKLSWNGNFSYRLLIIVEKYQTYLRDLSHVIVHVNFTL